MDFMYVMYRYINSFTGIFLYYRDISSEFYKHRFGIKGYGFRAALSYE